MRITAEKKRSSQDMLLPLVNIIFLLLIFFVITGVIAQRPDFIVEYAKTRMSPSTSPQPGTLFVSADGKMFYDGRTITVQELVSTLRDDAPRDPDTPFPVVLDRDMRMETFLPISRALGEAGIARIRAVTLKAERR